MGQSGRITKGSLWISAAPSESSCIESIRLGMPLKYRERYIGAKLGPLSILFGLSPAKGPRPLPRPTLSDSAHEVVSEDGFSLLALLLAFFLTFFLLFSFSSSRRGEQIVFTALSSFHLSLSPIAKRRKEEACEFLVGGERRDNCEVLMPDWESYCSAYKNRNQVFSTSSRKRGVVEWLRRFSVQT